jgi:type II secretory pathway pseudopilin PulG
MSRHSLRVCDRDVGFSIIELLVSMVIAGIAFGALVPVFVQAAKTGSSDKSRAVGLNMAQQAVEGCRRLTFEQVVSSTWTQNEETATGVKPFTVTRTVVDQAASPSDARIVSKLVTVVVSWATPSPGGSAVLKTVLYRQFAGPQIVDFTVAPWDAVNEWITDSTVQLTASINAADVTSMAPVTVGGNTVTGYVEFMITSVSGVVVPTIRVPYSASAPAVYAATWLVPGGAGVSDGFWTFKAVAFSAQKYPGNSWEFAKRVESGPPPVVTNLVATAGEDWVSLTWSPSISNDLDSYEVYRTGPDGVPALVRGGPTASPKFIATGFTDSGLAIDTDYTYAVYAIDQVARKGVAATVSARTGAQASVQPAPATNLQATYSGGTAVLTWTASASVGVAGYRVFKDGVTDTWVATVSGPYCDLAQGYESTASYQVKPYLTGSVLSLTAFASIFAGPPTQNVVNYGGTPWVEVEIPEEDEFKLEVMNNVKSGKEALITLKYLGAEGKSVPATVNPSQRISYSTTEYEAEWEDLSAGVYQFSWEANGIKSGSRLVTLTAPREEYREKCIP